VGPNPIWTVSIQGKKIWIDGETLEMYTQRTGHERTQDIAIYKTDRDLGLPASRAMRK
jgi:hypothetical protein